MMTSVSDRYRMCNDKYRITDWTPDMTDELTICAAAFLRNKGKGTVTENEFLMGVSMDFHWMPYGDAKKLLSVLISNNVLTRSGEFLRPSFDIAKVDVPVAYRPSEQFIKNLNSATKVQAQPKPSEDVDLMPLLMSEATESGMERRDFISESNNLVKRLNIDILAAGLIVLRDRGIDIHDFSGRIYQAVAKK